MDMLVKSKSIQELMGHDVIVLIGAPCSGKTTQGKLLADALDRPYLSPGSLFRAEVTKGTVFGQQLAAYMDSGETIPNELTTAFLTVKFSDPLYENGMILDGCPRSASHLVVLENILTNLGRRILAAVYLDVPKAQLDERRVQRGRKDDNAITAERRYAIFKEDIAPLLNLLDLKKKLLKIQYTSESSEGVLRRILIELAAFIS
ncbi:unnamed protein product [Adineta ricciae]|uniref:Adenylate kinase n=1 Tax=Adineta ricciae TaxID=249248 RepID=A0A814SUY0_ADIRI|nr:unnamed protein product [Adineta ricciae]CAF1473689.1 unnamed protein product [Adineta ricciae]